MRFGIRFIFMRTERAVERIRILFVGHDGHLRRKGAVPGWQRRPSKYLLYLQKCILYYKKEGNR